MTKLCECGCGEPAPIADRNDPPRGYVRGQPRRFVYGHKPQTVYSSEVGAYTELDCGHDTPCWVWNGTFDVNGYARRGGKTMYRQFYKELVGDPPPGYHLHHECQNTKCVNPHHLIPLTPLDHAKTRRKLSTADVEAIRTSTGSTVAVGAQFGCHASTVWRIRARQQRPDD